MSKDLYPHLTSDRAEGAPLVFAFHGTGGDETQFYKLATALVPGGGVVSPRGDVSEHGAPRFFRRTGEGVYDMDDLARATAKMGQFIAAFREDNPGAPVYAFGYSNGANILASVLLDQPELFDRVALLHPLVTWTPSPKAGLAGQKVLITGGENDPIGPLEGTIGLIDWLRGQGAEVVDHIHPGGHELRQTEVGALQELFHAVA